MINSRLLLPIVEWGKWSIVLNHSDFSCCDGGNSLILALLQDLLISVVFLLEQIPSGWILHQNGRFFSGCT